MAWPVKHSTGTLSVNRKYLKLVAGRVLFPDDANPDAWSPSQEEEAKLAIEFGLRNFYEALMVTGKRSAHQWSFLSPVKRMAMVSGVETLDLPAGFTMLSGPMYYPPSSSALGPIIQEVGDHMIHERQQLGERTGQPSMVAVRVKDVSNDGVRYELLFWPTPDASYEFICRYKVSPDLLTADEDIPPGGDVHAQTIIESVMASAEELRGNDGLHCKRFRERLVRSITHDEQIASPDTLGYGHDRSDMPSDPYGDFIRHCGQQLVTYNGIPVE